MFPPVIRMGPPPYAARKQAFVVLLEKRGWVIAQWIAPDRLRDTDCTIPEEWRMIHPSSVRCWLPEDGS